MKAKTKATKLGLVVDQLGKVKARIADLEMLETDLRNHIIESGTTEWEGRLFRCTVNTTGVDYTDYKALVASLPPVTAKRLTRKFTTTKERTTVKVVSR